MGILIGLFWIKVAKDSYSVTSSPVEEMYHKQLVVTLDSILDARFDAGCCEGSIDNDSTYTMKAEFNRKFMPIE